MTREELEHLAAEYVLGVLEGRDAALAEHMDATDAAFAEAAAAWRERLREVDETAPPGPVPGTLWNAITESLEAPVAVPARLRPVILADARTAFLALWRNLAFWRIAGLASAAAALVLGGGLAVFAARDARTPVLVAVLIKEGTNAPGAVVHAFANGEAELIPLESIDVPPDRALEIWTLWDRARGPVSIGLLDRPRSVRLRLDQAPRTGPSQLFEITLEPKGGSPIGRPTGPILMKGTTAATL